MSRSSSAVVDSKVVEMSLENSNFEKNAAASLSTIQKLKEALNFTTSKDGMDKFNNSLQKVDFNPMTAGINSARQGISALDAVSFGFFSRIGSQIEQTSMQYAKMFTTQPIEDGFKEYELKMGAVQTILNSAKTKEGLPVTLDMVNQKLDELNTYADKTIYSFSDMTQNIGKFTNAGVDLDTAVAAIQGISNEAALAGANTQQASHAMYNFAQALSSGYVKLIDWKSIENANMATVDFKQTLIDTAVELGTVEKKGDEYVSLTTDMKGHVSDAFTAQKAFNDSLSAQWMTSDVLTTALSKYADETTELGQKASKAATEVKTFSQLIDTLKEAAGSGWAQTWELLIGDFDQSKKLFTMLSDTFGGIIDAQSKARNNLLKEGLGKPTEAVTNEYWKNLDLSTRQTKLLYKELMEVGKANGVAFKSDDYVGFINSLKEGWLNTDMLADAVKRLNGEGVDGEGMSKNLDEINEAARRVIRGDFGNDMPARIQKLNDEGFDGEKVQEYVNEIYKLSGGTWDLSDAILEQAAANVGLEESMKGTSGEFDNILEKVDSKSLKKSGRELLFDSIVTSIFAFKKIAGSIKGAWNEVFPPATGDIIYKIARAINDASKALRRFSLKNAEKIQTVFKGIFSVFDLVLRVGKALLGAVFKAIGKVFSAAAGPVGAFITKIAGLINMFHKWAVENQIVEKAIAGVEGAIGTVVGAVNGWIQSFRQIPQVQAVVEKFGSAFSYIYDNFPEILTTAGEKLDKFGKRVKHAFTDSKTPQEFFLRIKNAFKGLWKDISASEIGKKVGAAFKGAKDAVKGFVSDLGKNEDGTKNTFGKITQGFVDFKERVKNTLKGVDADGNKIDIFSGIKDAFSSLWTDISTSGIKEKIVGVFDSTKAAIHDFFTNLGTDSEGNLNTFGKIYTSISNGFNWIVQHVNSAKDAIHGFFEEHKIGETFNDIWSDISTGVSSFFENLPGFVTGAKGKFGEFIERVKDLGGIKFDNLGDIWAAFKETVGQYFKDTDIFDPIKNAFTNVWSKIKDKISELIAPIKNTIREKLSDLGINPEAAFSAFTNVINSLKESFADLKENGIVKTISNLFGGEEVSAATSKFETTSEKLKNAGKGFKDFFKNLKTSFKNSAIGKVGTKLFDFFKRIGNALLETKPSTIAKFAKAFIAFKIIKSAWNSIKGIVEDLTGSITGLWDAMANEKNAKANFINKASFVMLAAAIAIVAHAIKEIASIDDMGKAWQAMGMLAIMLAEMFVIMLLLNKFSSGNKSLQNGAGILAIGAAVAAIGLVIKEIASIDDMGKAWQALGMLEIMLISLAAVLIVGSKLAPAGIGFGMGMVAIAGALLLGVIALKVFESVDFAGCVQKLVDAIKVWNEGIDQLDLKGSTTAKSAVFLAELKAISSVLQSAAIAGFILVVGNFVADMTGQDDVMTQFSDGVKTLIDTVKAWNDEMNKIDFKISSFAKTALLLTELVQIEAVLAGAIIEGFISAVGNFVTDMMEQKSPMKQFRSDVNDLLGAVRAWQEGMDSITLSVGSVAKSMTLLVILAAIEVVLGAAVLEGFISAVFEFVTGIMGKKPPLEQFKQDIGDLLEAINIWQDGIADLDVNIGSVAKTMVLLSTMAAIQGVLIGTTITEFIAAVGDFVYKIMGNKGSLMAKFKKDVNDLASIITTWQEATKGITNEENYAIDAIDSLISTVAYMNEVSFWGSIGELITHKDFSKDFKTTTKDLGAAITNFMDAFDAEPADIEKATNIISALARLGGNLSMFVTDTSALANGQTNLQTFGQALGDKDYGLGRYLSNFVENCPDAGTFTTITASFRSLLNATQVLTEMELDTGDIADKDKMQSLRTNVSTLVGVVMATSVAGLASVGAVLFKATAESLSQISISDGDVTKNNIVSLVTQNVGRLKSMVESLVGIDTSGVDSFTGALDKINSADLSKAAENIDSKNAGSDTGKDITSNITSSIDSSSISSGVSSAISSALGSIDTSGFGDVGTSMTAKIGLGIVNGAGVIKSSLAAALDSALSTAEGYKSSFTTAGWNFSAGVGNGIRLNKYSAINAAIDMAKSALEAVQRTIDSHSPSRETEKFGRFFDLGFANGIGEYSSRVANESTTMAERALDGVRRAVAATNDILAGTDTQNPVITPVLDLSQVRDGANTIASLMPASPSLFGNFSAITENADAMRERSSNIDILNALGELGSTLASGRSGDTYNINGVTYDDGSNVAMAVGDLIRAARIERRA